MDRGGENVAINIPVAYTDVKSLVIIFYMQYLYFFSLQKLSDLMG